MNQNGLSVYLKAYKITKKENYIPGIIKSCLAISNAYFKEKQTERAKHFAEEAFQYTVAFDDPQEIINSCEQLKKIYLNRNNYKRVVELQNLIIENQSILNEDQNKNVALKQEFAFQNALKENKISELDKDVRIKTLESKQKTNAIILIVVLILVVGTIVISLFSRYKAKKKSEFLASQLAYTEQLLEEKQRASESEIKAIKSQMNPHFFYNALNSIQGYVLTGEQQKASESIGLFSELSRAVLESSRVNEISLNDELELLESYLKLECMRMPKIKYLIEKSEDLRLFDLYLPPMILQPIVENAVKHGLANKEEGGLIQLRFTSEKDSLLIEIEDDGIGRVAAGKIGSFVKRKGSSFSTEANLNRIELLNESFDLAITQEIIDKTDENGNAIGTLIRVNIPQNNF
jgi:LytS/YehU family sensor histidine kinase